MFKALLDGLLGRKTSTSDPHALYGTVVAKARDEKFYADFGVPDTFDGRFEMMVLHLYLLLKRIKSDDENRMDLSQTLFDRFIDDMGAGLREAGVGDSVVPKRLAKMSKVFYGRIQAWDEAFDAEDVMASLALAHRRNLFPDDESKSGDCPIHLAHYMKKQNKALDAIPVEDLLKDAAPFSHIEG